MKTPSISLIVMLSLCLVTTVSAERTLQRADILDIFQELTSQPRDTWIPAGTIVATHHEYGAPTTTDSTKINAAIQDAIQEYKNNPNKRERTSELRKDAEDAIPFNVRYKLANEYTMESRVEVRYDGARFYWEINMDKRQDFVRPDASLAGNTKVRDLGSTHREWNKRRIFAWDGQKYTTYTNSPVGGRAVEDTAGTLPRAVHGPLTAGLIPWGHSRYSYANLSAANVTAREVNKGKTVIEMTVIHPDGSSMDLVLDPAKAYAVDTVTLDGPSGSAVTYTCSDYRLVGSRWVPFKISIEERDRATNSLLKSDSWTFADPPKTNGNTPAPGSFTVPFGSNTLVEHRSPVTAASSTYIYSHVVDTDDLLMQRLAYAAMQGKRPQNCATAALQYVASQFGKSFNSSALASLVSPTGQTSLYQMKQFAQGAGLYCRAVRTDLAALRDLNGVKAILHIPGQNHFVVLNEVDDQYIWLTDLSSDKFHYRQSVDFFPQEWSEGVALLLSDRPISGRFTEVGDSVLAALIGSAWSCTLLLQDSDTMGCYFFEAFCYNAYTYWWERWGCQSSTSGTCSESLLVESQESPCIPHPIYYCTITCEWFYYHMSACK